MPSTIQRLAEFGRESGTNFFIVWKMKNTGYHLPDGWKYSFPGEWTGASIVAFWKADVSTWFANLDVLSYAAEVSPVALPLLQRLDEFFDAFFADWDAYIRQQPRPYGLKSDAGDVVFFLKLGAMACVAEYPDAPLSRKEDITAMLIDVAKIAYESTINQVVGLVNLEEGVAMPAGPGIRPQPQGFTSTQTASIEKALDWIAGHFPPLLADRVVQISPLEPNPDKSGGTEVWSGDILLETATFVFENADAKLIEVLTHEMFHAKADRLGRIFSRVKAKKLIGVPEFIVNLLDESEEDFIHAAGLAARAQYLDDTTPTARRLTFEDGWVPVLKRSDGDLRLPYWSPVFGAFLDASIGK